MVHIGVRWRQPHARPPMGAALKDLAPGDMTVITISDLPTLNAALNGTSAVLLTVGYFCIRRKKVTAHKVCMGTAFATSTLFLMSYLTLRYYAGMTPFTGQGWIRPVYFTILISHTILAATMVPLAVVTLFRALAFANTSELPGGPCPYGCTYRSPGWLCIRCCTSSTPCGKREGKSPVRPGLCLLAHQSNARSGHESSQGACKGCGGGAQ